MFALFVELEAQTGKASHLQALLEALTRSAAQEPGILFYAVHTPEQETDRFLLYECYENKQAWETHLQHPRSKTC